MDEESSMSLVFVWSGVLTVTVFRHDLSKLMQFSYVRQLKALSVRAAQFSENRNKTSSLDSSLSSVWKPKVNAFLWMFGAIRPHTVLGKWPVGIGMDMCEFPGAFWEICLLLRTQFCILKEPALKVEKTGYGSDELDYPCMRWKKTEYYENCYFYEKAPWHATYRPPRGFDCCYPCWFTCLLGLGSPRCICCILQSSHAVSSEITLLGSTNTINSNIIISSSNTITAATNIG